MIFTENMLDGYAAPLSDSEDERCRNAIRMVSDALKEVGYSEDLKGIHKTHSDEATYELRMFSAVREVKLLVQGSYANNTNVKANSDVDVAVILESTFRDKYRFGYTREDYGFSASTDSLYKFKNDVEKALKDYFGSGVERKNKSIKVHGNTYRVDADTVPCQRYRDYSADLCVDPKNYKAGILILSDKGEEIINYPEQHIANGRMKNELTNHLYKKMVRIMKKMRYLMEDENYQSAGQVSSFQLESILWNVPDSWYRNNRVYRKVYIFDQLIDYLRQHDNTNYKEANGIKDLFTSNEERIRMDSFLNDLRAFYTYE